MPIKEFVKKWKHRTLKYDYQQFTQEYLQGEVLWLSSDFSYQTDSVNEGRLKGDS